jgi:DNA-binding response OmpR family regulator
MVPHVLIIDADGSAAQVTSAIVSRTAPEAIVRIAPAAEPIELRVQGRYPDVLIIDPAPYDLAGVRLIRELKAARADSRVIVVTSSATPAFRRIIAELKVDAYLEKPVLLSLFRQQLRALLRNDPAPINTELGRLSPQHT